MEEHKVGDRGALLVEEAVHGFPIEWRSRAGDQDPGVVPERLALGKRLDSERDPIGLLDSGLGGLSTGEAPVSRKDSVADRGKIEELPGNRAVGSQRRLAGLRNVALRRLFRAGRAVSARMRTERRSGLLTLSTAE